MNEEDISRCTLRNLFTRSTCLETYPIKGGANVIKEGVSM